MVHEINIENEKDKYYDSSMLEFTNEVHEAVTQLRMLFNTQYGEVLGYMDFGTDLEHYVFDTIRNSRDICEKLYDKIQKYVFISPNLKLGLDLNFGKDNNEREFAVLDISLNGTKAIGFLIDRDE